METKENNKPTVASAEQEKKEVINILFDLLQLSKKHEANKNIPQPKESKNKKWTSAR